MIARLETLVCRLLGRHAVELRTVGRGSHRLLMQTGRCAACGGAVG